MSFSDIPSGNVSTIRPTQKPASSGGSVVSSSGSSAKQRNGSMLDNVINPGLATADSNITELGDSLRKFQNDLNYINNRISEMKRKSNTAQEKSEIDKQLRLLKESEGKIQVQIEQQLQQVSSLPRAEAAQRRHTILKLQKDFDRVKPIVLQMFNDVSRITIFESGDSRDNRSKNKQEKNRNNEPQLIQAVVGQDVDELIMAEREADILRLNRDIALVNEMFKDMADIVDKQGVMIEEVHKSTEEARDKAEAGLGQVKQAADYQPVCIIS